MDLILANKYGSVQEKTMNIPMLSAQTFFKPIYLTMSGNDLNEPYRQHVWTYTCINAKATALKGVPFLILKYDSKRTGSGKAALDYIRSSPVEKLYKKDIRHLKSIGFDIVESGAAYDLFNKPNPLMCRSQLWESYMILKHLTGEVFWVLDGGVNGAVSEGEMPKEIYAFGKNMFDQDVKDGRLIGWKRKKMLGMEEKTFELHQVIRFYYYNPYDFVRGLAPFDVVKSSAEQDLSAQVFNRSFFKNGAMPGGFIKVTEFLNDDQSKKVLTKFNDKYQGEDNAFKTALLQGGADYIPNPNNHSDMQFIDGRKWNRDETFAGLGVPKMKGSIYEDLQLATALQADKSFWQDQIIPEARYIEDVVNSTLFSGRIKENAGLYCYFDFSNVEALKTNMVQNAEIAKTYYDMGVPLNQINERLNLGFESVPWGDVAWKPMSVVPIDEDFDKEPEKEPEEKPAKTIRNIETKADTRSKLSKLWIARVFDPIEEKFQKKLKTYWFELRKEQLKKFDEATKSFTKAVPSAEELDKILFNNAEWQSKLKEVSKPFLQMAAQFSIEDITELLEVPVWDTYDPRILTILENKANKIVGVTDRFWNALKADLKVGIQTGETVQELSNRIRNDFNVISSPARTLTIARTETAQIASPVRHEVMKGEGVTKVDWSTAGDEQVRDDHNKLDGVGIVNIGHNYMDDLGKPGTLRHPSDPNGPADQVINCRCVELPAD